MNNLPQVTICLLLVRLIAFLLLNIFIFSLSFAGVRSISSAEWGVFGNAEKNDNIFEFPASALSFAGFWYEGASSSPFTFSAQGQLTFTASVPDGQTARVYFRFEKNPWPDTEPSYDTEIKTIVGGSPQEFTLDIPAQGANAFSSFLFYIVDRNVPVTLEGVTVTYAETSLPQEYIDYYTPSNVQFYNDTFTFGKNLLTGEPISWQQEVNYNPYNSEIQDYLKGYTGLDDNNNLVLRIQRNGTNSYQSSRVNTQLYDGIKVGVGEKLSVEFEAQLPVARDANGLKVENVPLWPALWMMGNDQLNGSWIGWPHCAEIDVMEWSPTKPPTGGAAGYDNQANIAYHYDGTVTGYNPYSTANYYDQSDIHTKFHKWRVDIYRHDDGTTNKIEMFIDDVFISGSRYLQNNINQEFWRPSLSKDPETFGNGDKEYFLIMNIALGGNYPETSNVPSNFQYAEMVIKNVTYEVSSTTRYELELNFDPTKVTVSKNPNIDNYPPDSSVLVQAVPSNGYILSNSLYSSRTILMNEDKSFNINVNEDTNDSDGDGLNNYQEAVIYNSNLYSADSDNDNSSDYFESIAGTSLIDSSDFFYLQGFMGLSGKYTLEYDSKSNRNYSINVSDDLINWYNWKIESGNGSTQSNVFDPSVESITGLDSGSNNFFFKVDIE
jgi:hypothetical protein